MCNEAKNMKSKNFPIGPYSTFVAPFQSKGYWVEDARGLTVCECTDSDIARGLVDILNKTNQK
jgi:hypothetical protein